MGLEHDRHHLFWPKKDYDTAALKGFRQQSGLIVPMYRDIHDELHANLTSPKKPHRKLIRASMGMFDEFLTEKRPKLDRIKRFADFCIDQAYDDDISIGIHLYSQLDYLEEGYCERI